MQFLVHPVACPCEVIFTCFIHKKIKLRLQYSDSLRFQMNVFVDSTIVRGPLNTAVVQGSPVTLECLSFDNRYYLQWFHNVQCWRYTYFCYPYIYNGRYFQHDISPRFSVTEVDNSTLVTRNLNINSTQLTDAGVYLCAEGFYGDIYGDLNNSAQLIVLGNCTLFTD